MAEHLPPHILPPGIDPTIDCIDCGGRCHPLVNWPPDDPPQPDDIVAYRCEDCRDAWYIVVPELDSDSDSDGDGGYWP